MLAGPSRGALENEKGREPDVCPCVVGPRLRVAAPRSRGNEKAAGPWSGPRLRFLVRRRYRRETRPSWARIARRARRQDRRSAAPGRLRGRSTCSFG